METTQRGMTHKLAQYSLWEAIGANDLAGEEIRQSGLESDEAAPFDKIMTDYDCSSVIWEKTFANDDLGHLVPFPLYLAYLKALMPELYGLHLRTENTLLVSWITRDVDDVLAEAYEEMSDTTKAVVTGSVTMGSLLRQFFTPEVIAKARVLQSSTNRLSADGVIRILMNGESVALVDGTL
jgi:hypothetical protein